MLHVEPFQDYLDILHLMHDDSFIVMNKFESHEKLCDPKSDISNSLVNFPLNLSIFARLLVVTSKTLTWKKNYDHITFIPPSHIYSKLNNTFCKLCETCTGVCFSQYIALWNLYVLSSSLILNLVVEVHILHLALDHLKMMILHPIEELANS